MDLVNGPRAHRDPDLLRTKRGLLTAPHMAALTEYVIRLRERHGQSVVPDFDPAEAGIKARILLLLEAPGAKATVERGGSGFVSPNNNDATANNMWHLLTEAGINRAADVVTWNIVPWYIGDEQRIRGAEQQDLVEAREAITELLALLSNLKVVVLIGKAAAKGWAALGLNMPALYAPHPSPRNLNSRPWMRDEILNTLREAKGRIHG